jgi:hypothetical protein
MSYLGFDTGDDFASSDGSGFDFGSSGGGGLLDTIAGVLRDVTHTITGGSQPTPGSYPYPDSSRYPPPDPYPVYGAPPMLSSSMMPLLLIGGLLLFTSMTKGKR